MRYIAHGTCHDLAGGLKLMTSYVNGIQVMQRIAGRGSCHEAAYRATVCALRWARLEGETRIVLVNTNRHVVYQVTGGWRARKPLMRLLRDHCRQLARGMSVSFQV